MTSLDSELSTRGNNFGAEAELILRCACKVPGPEGSKEIALLASSVNDWSYVLQIAKRHGLMPLLCQNLRAYAQDVVPFPVRDELRAEFQRNARRNLFLAGKLVELLDLFRAHDIAALPHKGPVLACLIYGNLALRQFNDLDVFVRSDQVSAAARLLSACGYVSRAPLTERNEKMFVDSQSEWPFESEDGYVHLELHWELFQKFDNFPLMLEPMWKRADDVLFGGRHVPILCSTDLLLALAAHGCFHMWERLGWVCDIAELVRSHPGLDWREVFLCAQAAGIKRMILLGLFLAKELLRVTLPAEVIQKIRTDRAIEALSRRLWQRMFRRFPEPFGGWEMLRFYLQLRERPADKLRSGFHMAFSPSRDDLVLPWLPAAAYLFRPLRVALKYTGQAFLPSPLSPPSEFRPR